MPDDPSRPDPDRPTVPAPDQPSDRDAVTASPIAEGTRPGREQVVTLAEETATITKRLLDLGIVRVRTVTEVEEHVEHAALDFQTAEVSRHPVNRFVEAMPGIREEDDVTILPVVEERLVIEKRLFVTEEIHIRRVRSTEHVDVPVSLRRQHAVVERLAPDGATRDEP